MNGLNLIALIFSAFLYAIPFIYNIAAWWIIFIFPIPLFYLIRTENLSFIHGYLWGIIIFLLHLSEGIFIVAHLADNFWWFGFLLGICMVFYQALYPGLLFYGATTIINYFFVQSPMSRLFIWIGTLFFFIFWVDRYCLWIFGIPEGYPLMHPLILLSRQPGLLLLLPILGKQLLTVLFLLVPASFVLCVWYKNRSAFFFFISICVLWLWNFLIGIDPKNPSYSYDCIKSLPCMTYCRSANKEITMKMMARDLRKVLAQYPNTTTIIMPESALNMTDFESNTDLLYLWNEQYIGKPINIIFGSCCAKEGNYYNSLYWVYDGVLQKRFDKKHAMLITERLSNWMNYDYMRTIYFKDGFSITQSNNKRIVLKIAESISFVPYICSELFFNEYPDDCYPEIPILAIVNDILFEDEECGYMKQLLVQLAQFKAIQWQREIVYVSYCQSVVIDKHGRVRELNG